MFYILPSLRIKFNSGLETEYYIYFTETFLEAQAWVREQKLLLR